MKPSVSSSPTDIQEKMGVVNNGTVYGVYNYEAEKEDELSFKDGDPIKVIRKGDDEETEWWWASKDGKEGYIPCNLVAVSIFILISKVK